MEPLYQVPTQQSTSGSHSISPIEIIEEVRLIPLLQPTTRGRWRSFGLTFSNRSMWNTFIFSPTLNQVNDMHAQLRSYGNTRGVISEVCSVRVCIYLCVFVAAREQLRRSRHSRTFLVESGTGELWSELQTGENLCVCVRVCGWLPQRKRERPHMSEMLMILTFDLWIMTPRWRHVYFGLSFLHIINPFCIFSC